MRVLFIEDDEAISHLVIKVLESKGHLVKHITRMSEVAQAAFSFDPEIVVTDLMLPDVGTHAYMDTLAEVVACVDTDRTPVIVYSGAPMNPEECIELGAMECLVKGETTPTRVPDYFESVMARHALNKSLRDVPKSPRIENMFDVIPNTDAMEEIRASTTIDPDVVSTNAHSLAEELRKLSE